MKKSHEKIRHNSYANIYIILHVHMKKSQTDNCTNTPFVYICFKLIDFAILSIHNNIELYNDSCPVSWGGRIHRLLLCRGVRPLTSVQDMTPNNLMVRFQ